MVQFLKCWLPIGYINLDDMTISILLMKDISLSIKCLYPSLLVHPLYILIVIKPCHGFVMCYEMSISLSKSITIYNSEYSCILLHNIFPKLFLSFSNIIKPFMNAYKKKTFMNYIVGSIKFRRAQDQTVQKLCLGVNLGVLA